MSEFPQNIVDELVVSMQAAMYSESSGYYHEILQRPLRVEDPSESVGIFATEVTPNPDGRSMQIGQDEPAMNRYLIRLQNLITHTDSEVGRQEFTVRAKLLRVVLYRDTALHVRLRALSEELLGTREQLMRFGVARQRFLNNELNGLWSFLGSTDFWVDTELVKL